MTATPTNTPPQAPEIPPSRSSRFWLPVVALAALAVLLVGGYVALTRTSNDKADDPATAAAPAALGGASAVAPANSAAPSASVSA